MEKLKDITAELPATCEHPDPGELLAFVNCEASETARRAIVRHLLRGCAACAAAVRPVFDPGGERGTISSKDRHALWRAGGA